MLCFKGFEERRICGLFFLLLLLLVLQQQPIETLCVVTKGRTLCLGNAASPSPRARFIHSVTAPLAMALVQWRRQ